MDFKRLSSREIEERLSPEHIEHLRSAFRSFDKQKTGYIVKPDLRNVLKSLGHNPPDKVVDELILSVDLDQNKKLDFDEFLEMIANLESVGLEEENDSAGEVYFPIVIYCLANPLTLRL